MKSIRTPGMRFETEQFNDTTQIFFGKDKNNLAGSVWQLSLKERLSILFGRNIMAVFPKGNHPTHFYVKITKQKEQK